MKNKIKDKKVIELNDSNSDWIRGEVGYAAQQLKIRNLAHANEISSPVDPKQSFYGKYTKRVLDIVLAGTALVITAPINLYLALMTYRDVGAPIIFKQKRSGKDLKTFELVKFRNMTNEKDELGNLLPPDQRITKFGQFVRSHSLDELLNFWSVF